MDMLLDLRPKQSKMEEKKKWKLLVTTVLICVFFSFWGIWYFELMSDNKQLSNRLMYLEAENIKIEDDLYDYQKISDAYLESEEKALKAQSILDTNIRWSVILHELIEILPDGLIIEYYDASIDENIVVKGMSDTVKDIAKLKESLKEKPYYTNVLLNLIDKRVRSDNEVYYFELSARLTEANIR